MADTKENAGDQRRSISGLGQKIIGEVERIGGILTGDPITEAEGEFNVEVGTVREELEEADEEANRQGAETPREDTE